MDGVKGTRGRECSREREFDRSSIWLKGTEKARMPQKGKVNTSSIGLRRWPEKALIPEKGEIESTSKGLRG